MAMKRRRIKSKVEENKESMEKKQKSQSKVAQAVKIVHKNMARENMRWSDLPYDILESIMKRLFYADLINFHAVCKSWNSINRGTVMVNPLIKQLPWLVIFDETLTSAANKRTSCSCKLVDSEYNKTYTIDTSNIMNNLFIGKVHESKYGWLLISSDNYIIDHSLFAYTPFSSVNNLIQLPAMKSKSAIEFATFTSNPSMDQDCLFIVLHDHKYKYKKRSINDNYYDIIKISTCRRGEKSWSTRYLKFSLQDSILRCTSDWIYSEGFICYMATRFRSFIGAPLRSPAAAGLQQVRQLVPWRGVGQLVLMRRSVQIVKWEVMKISSSHGSVMNELDEDDDDSKYWLSKLRKDNVNPVISHGKNISLKIVPPPHH